MPTLSDIAGSWRYLAAQAPVETDNAVPWFLDEPSGDVFVASSHPQMTAYLRSREFAEHFARIYPDLTVHPADTDEAGVLFARALRSLDERLRRLGG